MSISNIDKWRETFWKDFPVNFQDQDPTVNFTNPSDVARCLIKARNWAGTITETLIRLYNLSAEQKIEIKRHTEDLIIKERKILSGCQKIPSAMTKNKEIQRSFVLASASEEEYEEILAREASRIGFEIELEKILKEIKEVEAMRHALEISTEWLIQYLNWHKHEVRLTTDTRFNV